MFRFHQLMGLGLIQTVFYATAQGAAPAGGLNEPVIPGGGEEWPEGDLPEQMGGPRTLLMPGQSTFKLPENLPQLWHDVAIEDTRPYLASGQVNPTGPLASPDKRGKKIGRKQLKMDRNNPLIVVGGKQDGEPMTATFTTNPRARGKKDDPKTPWISDIAFMLDTSLGDKSRPKTPEETVATVNRYAGKTIRLEHGLTAQCRDDKVRYINVQLPDGTESNVPDPTGTKGCGKRWYTKDFKNPETGHYDTEIACVCGQPKPEVIAALQAAGQPVPAPVVVVLRAYESIERFLPPIAVGPAPGQAV
jgi:hypothetical protein